MHGRVLGRRRRCRYRPCGGAVRSTRHNTAVVLTAATYLGDNTIAPLTEFVAAARASGVEMEIVYLDSRTSEHGAAHAADVDLVWMCGALFADMADRGDLSHRVLGAPVFAGESDPVYRSIIVAHRDGPSTVTDALDGRVATNEPESWSGSRTLRHHLTPRWFADEIVTGSHLASVQAVAEQRADCAAIDHTIWATRPAGASQLTVIGQTADAPAPPLLLRADIAPATQAILAHVGSDSGPFTGVTRFEPIPRDAYRSMSAEP